MIRVALLGYGLGGASFHAPLIATTPGLRLTTIVTGNPERRARAERDYPGVAVLPSAAEVFARAADHDLVVVTTPNRAHVPLALQAMEHGLAVVVDKPLAVTASEGRRAVEAARRHGVLLTVYQNRRWDGEFLTARALVGGGALGDVVRFESRFDRWRPATREVWRESPDPAEGGGILFDIGSHLIDQALVLLGPATHVYAEVDRRRPDARTDDDVFVALTHASGARSHLAAGLVAAQPGARLRVLGTRAAYLKQTADVQEAALRAGERPGAPDWGVDPEAGWGTVGAGDDVRRVPTERGDYGAFYRGVLSAMQDGTAPPVDPMDAVATLEIIEAARESSDSRRVVALGAPGRASK